MLNIFAKNKLEKDRLKLQEELTRIAPVKNAFWFNQYEVILKELREKFPNQITDIRALCCVAAHGIDGLMSLPEDVTGGSKIAGLLQFIQKHSLPEETAKWAVQCWANALSPLPLSKRHEILNEIKKLKGTRSVQMVGDVKRHVGDDGVLLEWQVGDKILDLYAVNHVFTSGGMGLVYRVHHQSWNVDLAVKSPRSQFFQTEAHKQNFVSEAQTWVNLGMHPHIASCFYVRTLGGIPRVFAEYIEGGSLSDWIKSRKLYEGGHQAALERMLDIAIQFAWGLHYAHEQGLVHQDVKPANVLMTADGTAKVSDFGLAKARASTGETQAMNRGGTTMVTTGGLTPAYASPEQVGRTKLTRRTDIWSWAVSVLEMFTGEITWMSGSAAGEALEAYGENDESSKLLPAMPAELAALLRRCFENDPAARPATMQVVADELRGIYQFVVGKEYPRAALQVAKALADSLNNKAVSLVDLGRREDAENTLEQALKIHAGHQMASYNLALLKWVSGKGTDEDVTDVADQEQRSTFKKLQKDFFEGCAALESKEVGCSCVMTLKYHQDNVLGIHLDNKFTATESRSISKDRKWVLKTMQTDWSLLKDSEQRIQLLDGYHCVQTFRGTNGRFSHKSDLLLYATYKRSAQLWDLSKQCNLRVFKPKSGQVACVAFSPDDRLVIIGSDRGTLQIFDTETGRLVQSFKGHTECISDAIFFGDLVISESLDHTLRLWDTTSGRCLHVVIAKELSHPLQTSLNGQWVVVSNKRFWNLFPVYPRLPLVIAKPKSFQELAQYDQFVSEALKQAVTATNAKLYGKAMSYLKRARAVPGFEKDPELVESQAKIGLHGKRCGINDVWQQHLLSGSQNAKDIIHLVFDSHTNNLSGYGKDKNVYVWDVQTGQLVATHPYKDKELPRHLHLNRFGIEKETSYSADKQWGATRSDGRVYICKLPFTSPTFAIDVGGIVKGDVMESQDFFLGQNSFLETGDEIVCFSPDSNWLACNSYNGQVQLWRIEWKYEFPDSS